MEKLFTTGQVAGMLQLTQPTIWRWVNEGRLKAIQIPGMHGRTTIRIPESVVKSLLGGAANA